MWKRERKFSVATNPYFQRFSELLLWLERWWIHRWFTECKSELKPNLTLNNKPIKLGWNGGSIQRFYLQQLTFSFVYVLAILNLAENIIFIFRVLFRGKSNLNGNWDSRGNYDHTCFLWELRKGNICIIKEITKKFFISNNNLLLLEILIILNNVNRSFDKVNIGELFRRK